MLNDQDIKTKLHEYYYVRLILYKNKMQDERTAEIAAKYALEDKITDVKQYIKIYNTKEDILAILDDEIDYLIDIISKIKK